MKLSKYIVTAIVIAVASWQPAKAEDCAAEGLVQSAGSAFSAAAKAGSPSGFASAAGRFTDIRGLAMFALGSYRQNLPAGQEDKYVSLAKGYIGRVMADNANSLKGTDDITVTSCSDTLVSARMASGGTVVFKLAGKNRIQDVNVAGIWVGIALRDRFTGIIRSHGGDVGALLAFLSQ